MSEPLLKFQGVSKGYLDKLPLFESVDFEIAKGEFIFLTGASGSGKTTLLKFLNKTEKQDRGTVSLNGVDLSKIPVHSLRREVGFIFQDYKLLEKRTVRQNVALPLTIMKYSAKEIEAKLAETAEFCMIDKLLNQKVFTLSGGEQQLVAIARAAIYKPKIILADEPTANLDRVTAMKILSLFQSLQKIGVALVVATHDVNLIKSYRSRIILIKDARIQEIRV